MSEFEEYIRQGEPDRQQRAYAWQTAIGLQAVDGLVTSDYLKEAACRHIEGDITIDEVRQGVRDYYRSKAMREPADDEMREADSVSANITKILSTKTLDFSTKGYVALHRRIFEGVFKFAGKLRDYDITKKEWVLGGDTVSYLHWEDLRRAIDHDLEQERAFRYAGLSDEEMVAHITRFVSGLWQIHPFGEGNTRTTAVFLILYLRSIGFDVTNNLFAAHSWYFRNALVRANYKNARQGIDYTPVYLERFFRNLLLGEHWELKNRYLHIHPSEAWREQRYLSDSENATVLQDKYRTSTGQVQGKCVEYGNVNVARLLSVIGDEQVSVKTMMERLQLKGRDNFLNLYLLPALRAGFVVMRYPESPRHPRQQYLLTSQGLSVLRGASRSN